MRARLFALCLLLIAMVPSAGAQKEADPTPLPIRRVILYKSGVGYFEHLGSVTGSGAISIQFTTNQLNDVLQSLTALDLDGGAVTNISYNSVAPVDQRLAALRLPLDGDANRLEFYKLLRGAQVDVVKGAATTKGRVLAVEQRDRARNGVTETVTEMTLVSDEGTVRTIELTPDTSLHLDERDLRQDLSSYLEIVASTRDADARRMVISTTGTGTRRLFISYISDVPIWKSTYRLVLPSDTRKPVLQGWAVVDNTVGQDWTNVELSLVAGAPQSFVQPISQPYYAQRPVVPLPPAVLLQPQTHGPTLTAPVSGKLSETVTVSEARGFGVAGGNGNGRGGGVAGGVAGGLPAAPPPAPSMPAIDRLAAQQEAMANGQDLGDLFEYKLKQPVTIRKNESALVPILTTDVDAERVSMWNRGMGSGRPLRAVWLTNTSALTLDGGSFTIIDANAFAGQGLMDSLKPGERRLVSYGSDLAVIVKGTPGESSGHVVKIVARDGLLVASREDRATWKYTARNEDTTPRTLIVEHPLRNGWTVGPEPAVAETSPTAARYRMTLAPKQEQTLTVSERHAGDTTYRLLDVDDKTIALLVRTGASEAAIRKELQPLLDKRAAVAAAEARLAAIGTQIEEIGHDQDRLRENMQALKGSAEEKALIQRYTKELNGQEDTLIELRQQQKEATAERDARRRELDDLAAHLTFGSEG